MASPFSLFRKNQKVMMAALVLLAMVAFVLSDAIDFSGRGAGGGAGQDPVVVESKFFDLKESDIDRAIGERLLVHQILTKAASELRLKQELNRFQQQFQGLPPEFLQEQLGRMQAQVVQQTHADVVNFIGSADETSVVETITLADTARRMGVRVSNERVEGFIFSLVPGMTKEMFVDILKKQPRLSLDTMYDAFRRELLADSVRSVLARNSASTSTPIDRWNFFLRKNLRASVEVLPVRTADLIKAGKVAEPTKSELTAFYEKYKFLEPVPGSPVPGFKVPQKASFQYFVADEAKFYAPEKITTEAIAAHYEANKARYPYTPEDFSDPAAPAAATIPAATTPPAGAPGSIAPLPALKANPAMPTATKPEVKVEPKSETKPEATKPATDKKEPEKKEPAKKEEKKPEAKLPEVKKDTEKKADDAKKSEPKDSGCDETAVSDVVSFDVEASASDCQVETAKPTATPSATKPAAAPSASPSATAAPAATPSATATPSAAATPSATGTAAAPAVAAPVLPPSPLPSEDVMLPEDVRTGREPQFDPLWRVEDKIRKELADAAARDEIKSIFDKLRTQMNDKSLALIRGDQKDAVLFTEAEWAALAKPYPGLEAKSTGLVDRIQAIASSDEPGLFHATINGDLFASREYSSNGTYTPNEALEIPTATGVDALSNPSAEKTVHYLYWKTKNEEAHTPELASIEAEVKFAWQTEKARKLVREEAAALAKKARETPKPLSQVFPDRDVKRTNAFMWYETDLSGGFGREQPTRLSKVDNVEDPGPDFMQAVFGLDVGQVATAMNNPENICYVIHVVTMDPSRQKLLRDFEVDHFETYMQFGAADARRLSEEATEALISDAGLHWIREAKAPSLFDQ